MTEDLERRIEGEHGTVYVTLHDDLTISVVEGFSYDPVFLSLDDAERLLLVLTEVIAEARSRQRKD